MDQAQGNPALVVQAGGIICAFWLSQVVETMRPLDVKPLANLPEFILGVALVRGNAVPVIDLGAFLGRAGRGEHARFVTLRTGERRVAVLVDEVVGIRELGLAGFGDLPPLLSRVRPGVIEAIGEVDSELVVVLASARLVPDTVWAALRETEVAP